MYYLSIASPIGAILLAGDGTSINFIGLPESKKPFSIPTDWRQSAAPFIEAQRQFAAYFAGNLIDFDLPIAAKGTPFQQSVWQALNTIPYGETISYAELARRIGKPNASRAVGLANGANPLSIIVPCHRVIGANGALTGYGGGLEAKTFLLNLERRHAAPTTFALSSA